MSKTKLSKEALEARKNYHREWQKANPEKIKEYQVNYWNKKALQAQEAAAIETQ